MPVVVIYGAEYHGEQIEVSGDRLTIGRSAECDVILRSKDVSSHHAQLVSRAGFGNTLRLISNGTPRVPMAPVMSRDTSKPATFFITLPPNCRIAPLPLMIRVPNT